MARAVSWARSLTSLATTAKPLPASPARAASMVALRASRLVCSAIEVMTLTTLPISAGGVAELGRRWRWWLRRRRRASPATRAASCAFWAISRIEAPISSVPAATVCTLRVTSSAAAATTPAWALVCLGAGGDLGAQVDDGLPERGGQRLLRTVEAQGRVGVDAVQQLPPAIFTPMRMSPNQRVGPPPRRTSLSGRMGYLNPSGTLPFRSARAAQT